MIQNHQPIRVGLSTGRRRLFGALACLFTISACNAAPMTVTLDIVTFNYLNRPILDVFVNGKGGDSSTAYPATGGGTIMGEELHLGPQKVTWRLDGRAGMPRNGEMVTAKNIPQLVNVPADAVFLGVHVYPDDTVELIPTRNYPHATEKGVAMSAAVRR